MLNSSANNPVLILGPTGAGKTEIAELIHSHSPRKNKPFHMEQAADSRALDFVAIKARWVGFGENSGYTWIPKEGIKGIIENCAGGTVFIDEIAQLSEDSQGYMRTLLDPKSKLPPAAGNRPPMTCTVRFIFATNRDLQIEVNEQRFLHDLFERIKRFKISIPPLIDRQDDIILFVSIKCEKFCPSAAFLLALLSYEWPGNVRELIQVLEIAMRNALSQSGKPREVWDLYISQPNSQIVSDQSSMGKATASNRKCVETDIDSSTKGNKIKLELTHLELEDSEVIPRLVGMQDVECERALYVKLLAMLQKQGYRKGEGLQNEMARVLQVSPASISTKMKKFGL